MEECFERGAPSWSYITEFGMDRKDHHQGSVLDGLQTSHEAGSEVWDDAHTLHPSNETIALPKVRVRVSMPLTLTLTLTLA